MLVLGSIDWSPENWSYETSDAEVALLLSEVKAKGEVIGHSSLEIKGLSIEEEDTMYCFVQNRVESSSPEFIDNLSNFLTREFDRPNTTYVWITKSGDSG